MKTLDPEWLHLVLNHIPIHGLVIAVLVLAYGVIGKHARIIGLGSVMILICSASIPFVMGTGEAAYEAMKEHPEQSHVNEADLEWAKTHYDHAETGAKVTYLLILVSGLLLAFFKWKPAWVRLTAVLLLVLTLIALALNAWIASSGGKIRRPHFRPVETAAITHEVEVFSVMMEWGRSSTLSGIHADGCPH